MNNLAAVSANGSASGPDEDDALAHEQAINGFEYAIWHLSSAFARWRRDCLACLPGEPLSGAEASILHIVHLNNTPKGVAEISRLLHRDDIANLQYGIKRLLAQGFIEKADPKAPKKSVTYLTSDKGRKLVEAYLQLRRETLLRLTDRVPGMTKAIGEATTMLHVMIGMYDQASNIAAGHGGPIGRLQP